MSHYLEGKLPKGMIHGDLFADNLLFRGERLTSVLDFEAACRGKFIFDIATAVNALCFVDGRYSLDRFRYRAAADTSRCARSRSPNGTPSPTSCAIPRCASPLPACTIFSCAPDDGVYRVNKDFREFFERLRILRREKEGGMEALLMAMATGYDYRKYQKVKASERQAERTCEVIPLGLPLPLRRSGRFSLG